MEHQVSGLSPKSNQGKVKRNQIEGSNTGRTGRRLSPLAIIQRAAMDNSPLTPADIMQLHKTAGNKALGRLLEPMNPVRAQEKGETEAVQGKFETGPGMEEESLRMKRENHTGMPDNLKAGVESLSGLDMSGVQVHFNSSKPAEVGALAYTRGMEIHVAPGQERHLPHEAWHVVQQARGRVSPTMQLKGLAVNDDVKLEREADVMGARALQTPESERIQLPDEVLPDQGAGSVIPAAQRMGVIQRSSDENEAIVNANIDIQNAQTNMAMAQEKIEAIRKGQSVEEMAADPFAGFPQTTGRTVATRRTVTFEVDRGNGWERYRVPVENLEGLIKTCMENHWQIQVDQLPRGFQWNSRGEVIQRAATAAGYNGGDMDEWAAATVLGVPAPNLANATLTFVGVTARNTSTGASGTSLNRQPMGTGVGGTRPNQWVRFIGMIGAINPFKQGHMISQRLGGDGTHDNLSPFTASLNAVHYNHVERHVINQTEAAPGRDQYADYTVTPTYAGNPGIVAWAQGRFALMAPNAQRAAMVAAGIMTAAAAAGYVPGAPLTPVHLAAANAWIAAYINVAFCTDIVCQAEFIDAVGGGAYNSTPPQVVTITNDF